MAQTVDTDFTDEWAKKTGKVAVLRVRYKRRYWDGAAYDYEPTWNDLPANEFGEIEGLSEKLDTPFLNVFQVTELTLRLRNHWNEWVRSTVSPSRFKADGLAALGYDDHKCQFQIQVGYLVDGTPVRLSVFTGVAINWAFDGRENAVDVTVSSKAALLSSADASQVDAGEIAEGTIPAIGDGTETDFRSVTTGIRFIETVSKIAPITVGAASHHIDFDEGAGAFSAILDQAAYPVGESDAETGSLCEKIKEEMELVGAGTYSVVFDLATRIFTIAQTAGTGTLNLLWNTGGNKANSAAGILGYDDSADDTGATSYAADSAASAATELDQGDDYTIEDLAKPIGAKLVLAVALTADWTLLIEGRGWLVNQTVDTLLGLLYDEGGIGAGDREISPIVIPGGVAGSKEINSQADWEAGTLIQNITTTNVPGSIQKLWSLVDDFSGTLSKWSIVTRAGSGSVTIVGGKMALNTGANSKVTATTPLSKTTGTWSAKLESNGGGTKVASGLFFGFADASGNGYAIAQFPYGNVVQFVKLTGWFLGATLIANLGTVPASETEWRITRTVAGDFEIFKAGVSAGSVNDLSYTSWTTIALMSTSGAGATHAGTADDIYYSSIIDGASATSDAAAVHESEEFDLLSTPDAMGTLEVIETLNGGAVTYKTATSAISGAGYEAWVARDAGTHEIQSTPQQYLKVQTTIVPDATLVSPEVSRIIATFQTSAVFVAVANHSGRTCLAQIDEYVKLVDFEEGFKGDGTAFVRAKTTAASILSINQENAISRLVGLNPGYDRVFNVGQVYYGDYFSEYDSASAGAASPNSEERFGRRILAENLSNILTSNDLALAAGRSQVIYDNHSQPKRRVRLLTKLIPWLELGDVLTVTYFDHPMSRETPWGDPLAVLGKPWIAFGGPASNVLLSEVDFKILAIFWNLKDLTMQLTLEEVLT